MLERWLRTDILDLAEKHGFSAGGVVDLAAMRDSDPPLKKDLDAWKTWIAEGANAGMKFMELNANTRADSSFILENACSAIPLTACYATGKRVRGEESPLPEEEALQGIAPLVARYAHARDYHKILKRQADTLISDLRKTLPGVAFEARAIIDTVPFLERAHGREAGVGFVGKNTMLIRPGVGSYFFIATLLTTLPAETLSEFKEKKNPIHTLSCGDCTRCMDACPTNALSKEYFLDARKCLSYLTIEHRDVVEEKYLPHFEKTIYGCDICQEVCPYNFSTLNLVSGEFKKTNAALQKIGVADVARMSQVQYEQWFGGSAMTRARYGGLVRNALYHLYATGSAELQKILKERTSDVDQLVQRTVAQLNALT